MKKLTMAVTLAALAGVPVLAMQPAPKAKQPAIKAVAPPRTVHGELTVYEMVNYNGDSFAAEDPSPTIRTEWRIRSLTVHPGDRWQICARPRFREPCIVLDRSVHDATLIGVENQLGSARLAPAAAAPAPAPAPRN